MMKCHVNTQVDHNKFVFHETFLKYNSKVERHTFIKIHIRVTVIKQDSQTLMENCVYRSNINQGFV